MEYTAVWAHRFGELLSDAHIIPRVHYKNDSEFQLAFQGKSYSNRVPSIFCLIPESAEGATLRIAVSAETFENHRRWPVWKFRSWAENPLIDAILVVTEDDFLQDAMEQSLKHNWIAPRVMAHAEFFFLFTARGLDCRESGLKLMSNRGNVIKFHTWLELLRQLKSQSSLPQVKKSVACRGPSKDIPDWAGTGEKRFGVSAT